MLGLEQRSLLWSCRSWSLSQFQLSSQYIRIWIIIPMVCKYVHVPTSTPCKCLHWIHRARVRTCKDRTWLLYIVQEPTNTITPSSVVPQRCRSGLRHTDWRNVQLRDGLRAYDKLRNIWGCIFCTWKQKLWSMLCSLFILLLYRSRLPVWLPWVGLTDRLPHICPSATWQRTEKSRQTPTCGSSLPMRNPVTARRQS
jgi:hypothetical protein